MAFVSLRLARDFARCRVRHAHQAFLEPSEETREDTDGGLGEKQALML